MKVGIATKKVLNFLSTSIMIGLGKVSGLYMVYVACINNKLVERARKILNVLFNLDDEEAFKRLQAENMDLNQVIKNIQLNGKE